MFDQPAVLGAIAQQSLRGSAISRQPVISRKALDRAIEGGEFLDEKSLAKIERFGLPFQAGGKLIKAKSERHISLKGKPLPCRVSEVFRSKTLGRQRELTAS